jgi:hypothetical protein
MPLPKGFEVFPAGYDELEIHVAGLCACVDFAGDPDADDLSIAAFNGLVQEEAKKNPTVPPAMIAANILTYIGRICRSRGYTLSARLFESPGSYSDIIPGS